MVFLRWFAKRAFNQFDVLCVLAVYAYAEEHGFSWWLLPAIVIWAITSTLLEGAAGYDYSRGGKDAVR